METKLNEIWNSLKIWDKVEALEYLGMKLNLTDNEQIEIAGLKASFEKSEEIKEEKENHKRVDEFMGNMWAGKDYKQAMDKLFKIR